VLSRRDIWYLTLSSGFSSVKDIRGYVAMENDKELGRFGAGGRCRSKIKKDCERFWNQGRRARGQS